MLSGAHRQSRDCLPPYSLLSSRCPAGSDLQHPPCADGPASPCRYFLPPIIFFAGLSVRKKSFFRNFITIASYGIVGTYISFAIIVCSLLIFKTTVGFLTTRVSLSRVGACPFWYDM